MDKNILSNIRDIAFVIGIYLFFTGWVYDYFYMNSFGIKMSQLDTNYATYLILSFNVFKNNVILSIVIALLLGYSFSGTINWAKYTIVICLFPVLYYSAYKTGEQIASDQYTAVGTLSVVKLHFTHDFLTTDTTQNAIQQEQLQNLIAENDFSQLYLVVETKEVLYMVYPPQPFPLKNGKIGYSSPQVYSVNKKYIQYYVREN